MASKISVLIDVTVDKATASLGSFKKSIADADGAVGKFKAGASSALDSVKANAGNLALAGGTALVAFGTKAVGAFQETALEAGKLSDSLGLTTEEASRMMEVSGDLDIGLGALETSLGKMNLAAARTPEQFDKIGAAIARNADGTTNVQQTFMNAIDAINKIPDATKRADAAARIFGKGWREISELIGRGSEELTRNLNDVGDAKVISPEEVENARQFRDKLDELGDTVSDLSVGVGSTLVPALTTLGNIVLGVVEAFRLLGEVADWDIPLLNSPEREADFDAYQAELQRLAAGGKELTVDIETLSTAMAANAITTVKSAGAAAALAAAEEAANAVEEERTEALDKLREATDKAREAEEARTQAVMESADSGLAYRNQLVETTEAITASNLAQLDETKSLGEKGQASRDAEAAALALADAAVVQARDVAEASGTTLTASQEAGIYKRELQTLASTMDKESAAAILKLIGNLDAAGVSASEGGTAIGKRLGDGFIDGMDDRIGAIERQAALMVEAALRGANMRMVGGGARS